MRSSSTERDAPPRSAPAEVPGSPDEHALEYRELRIEAVKSDPPTRILNGVAFVVKRGQITGLIGETGAGKSMTCWAGLGLLRPGVRRTGGQVLFQGEDLFTASAARLRDLRAREMGIIVQNPRSYLHPMRTIGTQLVTRARRAFATSKAEAKDRAYAALVEVGMPDPRVRLRAYPHELSGGMAQRVLIALAMIASPTLLVADEPTTGLDLTVQAQILDLIVKKVEDAGTSVLLVSHDLGVMAAYSHFVGVMYAGRVVEFGRTDQVLEEPVHPYTRSLVAAAGPDHRVTSNLSAPDLQRLPVGCAFRPRCKYAREICKEPVPSAHLADGRTVDCHRWSEIT